jgi:hypothetical protein
MFVAIATTVEGGVVPRALRIRISTVVEEVFHGYQAMSIGFVVVHSLSHPV